jgi:hypothetical protein
MERKSTAYAIFPVKRLRTASKTAAIDTMTQTGIRYSGEELNKTDVARTNVASSVIRRVKMHAFDGCCRCWGGVVDNG